MITRRAASFGPDKVLVAVWLALVSAPLLSCLWGIGMGHSELLEPLLIGILPPVALYVFVARFRVTYAVDRFIYRRWGPTIEVDYVDIAAIEVTNSTPVAKAAIGAFVVTRDGVRLPFWPKLFPTAAVQRFFELAPNVH